jgi:toxin HigB-1
VLLVIRSFRHKGLSELFLTGKSAKVATSLQKRSRNMLDALNQADDLRDVNLPGFNFHPLHGNPVRYSIHVNGPWCITFEWEDGNAIKADLEQYH